MALTKQDVELLTYPFPAKAHKFVGDMPYIHEEVVNDRLDMVDPSWTWKIAHVERRANAGENGKDVGTVWVQVTLTVKGVSRDAIGMSVIQQTNPIAEKRWNDTTKKNEATGNFYTSEANEAEKSATTDALKRAARMFGIGRYLLSIPKQNSKSTVTTIAQMETWLKATFGAITELSLYYEDEPAAPATTPLDPEFHGLGNDGDLKPIHPNILNAVRVLVLGIYDNAPHANNSLEALEKNGVIHGNMAAPEIAGAVFIHRAMKDFGLEENEVCTILGKHPKDLIQKSDSFKAAFAKVKKAAQEIKA